MEQRLQKLLASAGIASRRSSEELIARGKVTVNGSVVTEPGSKADPESDDIRVFGKPLPRDVKRIYILLNKPTGFVTTVRDRHAERTVMHLLQGLDARIYPVGRLDADSAGLLVLTNDGEFTKMLTHPSHQVPRTYRAVVRGKVLPVTIQRLASGVELEDGVTAPAEVQFVEFDAANNASILDIVIREGRNRQVRRMMLAVHHPVLALTRTQIGPLQLRGLPPGKWRKLHPGEVQQLKEIAESAPPRQPAAEVKRTTQTDVAPKDSKKDFRRAAGLPQKTNEARDAAAEITRKLRSPENHQSARSRDPFRKPGRRGRQ